MKLVLILGSILLSSAAHAFTYTYCATNGVLYQCSQGCTSAGKCSEIGHCHPSLDIDNTAPDSEDSGPIDFGDIEASCK